MLFFRGGIIFGVNDNPPARVFHPEMLSRRGELTAWGMALVFLAMWLFLRANGKDVWAALPVFGFLLLLAALSISLGNWMDRTTLLRLDAEGVEFHNILRHVRFDWDDIRQVRLSPATWSRRVEVFSLRGRFTFHTLGEIRYQGEVRGRVGFAQGDDILREIVQACHLKFVADKRPGYSYYTRE